MAEAYKKARPSLGLWLAFFLRVRVCPSGQGWPDPRVKEGVSVPFDVKRSLSFFISYKNVIINMLFSHSWVVVGISR